MSIKDAIIFQAYIQNGMLDVFYAKSRKDELEYFMIRIDLSSMKILSEKAITLFPWGWNPISDEYTYSGSLVLSDQEEELFSLDFNSLKVVDEEMGYSEGSMTFNVDEVSPITVNLSSDGKSQTIAYSINVEGEDYGTVELIYSVEKSASVEMPADNNIVTITAEDMYDFDIKEYASEEEVEAFIKNILTKIGINDESVDEMAKLAVDSIFAEGNAFEPTIFDDEEFNFDDEDFEFDDEDFEFNDEDFNFDDIDLEDYEMTEDELNDILAEIEALEPTTTAKAS